MTIYSGLLPVSKRKNTRSEDGTNVMSQFDYPVLPL